MSKSRWPDRTVDQRFWDHVDFDGPLCEHLGTRCWVWTGAIHKARGYGVFNPDGRTVRVHRWAYLRYVSDLPLGVEVDHRCRTRPCVNFDHMRPATGKQNHENLGAAFANNLTSGVRGVYPARSGRWVARTCHDGQIFYLGTYDTIEGAAEVVRLKRIELHTHNELDRANLT